MIKINHPNLDVIAEEYAERILHSIKKNILKESGKEKIIRELKKIYTAPFDSLVKTNEDAASFFTKNQESLTQEEKKLLFNYYKIINYKKDGETHAVWLIRNVGVTVCPYCNHNYIFTRDPKKGVGRAQLDHYYHQDKYPHLSLSFYNLIPSCSVCNQLKSTTNLDFSPYEKGLERVDLFYINNLITNMLKTNTAEIKVKKSKEWNKNIDKLNIESLYGQHTKYADDLIFKAQAYTNGYYNSIMNTFNDLGLSLSDMQRMIFGNYLEIEELGKQPLSKFSKDLLKQLGIDL